MRIPRLELATLLQEDRWLLSASAEPAGFVAFLARACCGGKLGVRLSDGEIINAGTSVGAENGVVNLVFLRPNQRPDIAFAVAATSTPLSIRFNNEREQAPVRAIRLSRNGAADTVALRHPLVERFVCGRPCATAGDPTRVTIDRPHIGGWELFQLEALEERPALGVVSASAVSDAVALVERGLGLETVVNWLMTASGSVLQAVGEAVLCLLSADAREDLASAALVRVGLTARLALLRPGDLLLESVLPNLVSWNLTRHERQVIPVGTDLDSLSKLVPPGTTLADPIARLAADMRRSIRPRKRLAIVATARNEGIYFLDWIAHHRAVGVEHFFIYSNNNDDVSDELLRRLAEAGVITYLPNDVAPPANGQLKAYTHALLHLPEILEYRWTALIDIDEFLVLDPDRYRSFPEFLEMQEIRGADSVALNWRMYTADRQSVFADRPVPERILRREPSLNPHVKSVVRTGLAWSSSCHAPLFPDDTRRVTLDASGEIHHGPGRPFHEAEFRWKSDAGPAWVNHYHLRSLPEYVWKASRNRGGQQVVSKLGFAPDNPFLGSFLDWFDNPEAVEDLTILAFAGRTREERDALIAVEGVAAMHAANVEAFGTRVTALVREVYERIGDVDEVHRTRLMIHVQDCLRRDVINRDAPARDLTLAHSPLRARPSALGPAIIHIQSTGNIANRMIQYMAAISIQARLNRPSRLSNVSLPEWKIELPTLVAELVEPVRRISSHTIDLAAVAREINAHDANGAVLEQYHQNIKNFLPAECYSVSFPKRGKPALTFGNDVLLISIRGAEILTAIHPFYILLPVEFYVELVAQTGLKPVFFGQLTSSTYLDALRAAFPGAEFIAGRDPMEDFEILRGARNICLSISTFAWTAAFLSDAKRIIFPVAGLLSPDACRCSGADIDLAPRNDDRYEYWFFPVNFAVPVEKVLEAHKGLLGRWHRLELAESCARLDGRERKRRSLDKYLGFFDEAFYRAKHSDIDSAVRRGALGQAEDHYRLHGFAENRPAFPLDSIYYARSYPDAAEAVGFGGYLDFHHFHVEIGAELGYSTREPT